MSISEKLIALRDAKTPPHDDVLILNSVLDYDREKDYLKYLIFDMVITQNGEGVHFYKAIKLYRLIRVPNNDRVANFLMEKQSEILASLWENQIHFITLIANILRPDPVGLMYSYGVQGIGNTIEEAKQNADAYFSSLTSALKGVFRTIEFRQYRYNEADWLRKKMNGMDHLAMLKGIPYPHQGTNPSSMSKSTVAGGSAKNDIRSQTETMEEFIAGMTDHEYVMLVVANPINQKVLQKWLNTLSKEETKWQAIAQGSSSVNFSVSLPMMFGGNLGNGTGYSTGVNHGLGHTVSAGTNWTDGIAHGATHGTSFTHSAGISSGNSQNISNTNSVSSGLGTSHTLSSGVNHSHGTNQGVNHGDSWGQGTGTTTGHTTGSTHTVANGTSTSHSEANGTSSSWSNGTSHTTGSTSGTTQTTSTGTSHTTGNSTGSSSSWGNSQSSSIGTSSGTSTAWSQGHSHTTGTSSGTSSAWSDGKSHTTGTSSGTSTAWSQGHSHTTGTSSGTSTSWSDGKSHTVGNTNGTSHTASSGTSQSNGTSNGTSSTNSSGWSSGQGSTWSNSSGHSQTTGTSNTTSHGTTQGNTLTHGVTNGTTSSKGTSGNQSTGSTAGSSTSQGSTFQGSGGIGIASVSGSGSSGTGTSTSNTTSVSNGHTTNNGVNHSTTSSHAQSSSQSTTLSSGSTQSQGTTSGHSYGGNSTHGLTGSTSHGSTSGTSSTHGTSNTTSNGTTSSRSISNGTTSSYGGGTSHGTTDSNGTSSSYGGGTSHGSTTSNGTTSSYGGGTSHGSTTSNGTTSSYGGGTSHGSTTSNGTTSSYGGGTSQGNTVGTSTGTTTGGGTSTSQTVSDGTTSSVSNGISNSTSVSNGTSSSVGGGTSQTVSNGTGTSNTISNGNTVSDSVSQSASRSYGGSNGVSSGSSVSSGTSSTTANGNSTSSGTSSGNSDGMGWNTGTSSTNANGVSNSQSTTLSQSKGGSNSIANSVTSGTSSGNNSSWSTGMSSSMGLAPGISVGKSYMWKDMEVDNVLRVLEYQRERLLKSLNGQGAFFVDVMIGTDNDLAHEAVKSISKASFYNKEALATPLQVLEPKSPKKEHLLYHYSAFSPCVEKEEVSGYADSYKYSTVLLPDELTAYTHPPRFSYGGLYADIEDMPMLSVPSDRQNGDIYMGHILSAQTWSEEEYRRSGNGYRTPFKYCVYSNELMHAVFQGESRSGKTVGAIRFVTELSKAVRPTGKRVRIIVFDQKADWRKLAKLVDPERFRFYRIDALGELSLSINLCKIAPNVNPENHLKTLSELFVSAYGLGILGVQIMKSALSSLYEKHDCLGADWATKSHINSQQVTLPKLYDEIKSLKDNLIKQGSRGNMVEAYDRVLIRLGDFTKKGTTLYEVFARPDGMGIHELLGQDDVVVVESSGLDRVEKNFIYGMMFATIYSYGVNNGTFLSDDQYETVVVVEEANSVLIGQSSDNSSNGDNLPGQSRFEDIIDQSAGNGMFVVSITQKIHAMPASIVNSCGIMFVGRSKDAQAQKLVMASIGKNEKFDYQYMKWLSNMPDLTFMAKTGRTNDFKNSGPVHVFFDLLAVSPPTDQELIEQKRFYAMKKRKREMVL